MDEVGNCVICEKEDILSEMFYEKPNKIRITIKVCEECMMKDLIKTLRNG